MKKATLCMAIMIGSTISGQAYADSVWAKFNRIARGGPSGFERIQHANKYESMQYDQSTQWSHAKSTLKMSRMHDVNILKKHCYDWDKVPMVTVGTNFYHLTGEDMQQVMRDFDTAYNYTDNGRTYIRIKDGVTNQEVGIYSKNGLYLQ